MGGYRALTKIQLPFTNETINIDEDKAWEILNAIRENRPCNIFCNNTLNPSVDLQIIIPAYNVEKYIRNCIDSILSQETEYSYRVFLTDDGSTDATGEIIDSNVDERIVAIHQENSGIASARNAGLKELVGKYVMFVDSDDMLYPNAIQSLMSIAYKLDADIVEGGNTYINEEGKTFKTVQYDDNTENGKPFVHRGQPWGKVIRAELFENVHFPDGFEYEDSIMGGYIYPIAEKSFNISDIVYGYRWSDSGISHTAKEIPSCVDTYYISLYLWDLHIDKFETADVFNIEVLNQMSLNHRRVRHWGEEAQKSGFVVERAAYLNMFVGRYELSGRYQEMDEAVRAGNWAKFKMICDRWEYLK